MSPKILPGRADPLGATSSADGTNFAVLSGGDEVTLCLFDADGAETQLFPNPTATFGTVLCRAWDPGGPTVSGSADLTIPPAACATNRPSCCSTPTAARSTVRCDLAGNRLGMQVITPLPPESWFGRLWAAQPGDSRAATGRARPGARAGRHDSVRGARTRVYRGPSRRARRNCAAAMRDWHTKRRWSTWPAWV